MDGYQAPVDDPDASEIVEKSERQVMKAPDFKQDAIPDLIKIGAIPSNTLAHVDTNILEPVIFSESFVRFQLDNVGFLNPYSRITFQLENVSASSASNTRSCYPLGVGVSSLIERVQLKVGGKTICEVDDFGHFQGYKSMFIAGEVNKEREQFLSCRQMSHEQFHEWYKNICTTLTLDNGKNYQQPDSEVLMNDFQLVDSKGVFSITLEELLPVFKYTALPLYLLNKDQAVQIELFLSSSTDGSRIMVGDTGDADTMHNVPMTLNRAECKMIADYTTYDESLMQDYAQKNQNLSWTFMDYQLTKRSVNQADAQNLIYNVGGAGRLVPRVFSAVGRDDLDFTQLLNKYSSSAPELVGTTYGTLTTNIKKNDKFIYPIDRSNTALHFHDVADAEGMTPFITRAEYSRQGQRTGNETFFEKRKQIDSLQGAFGYQAYKIVDGERVNSRGLEVHAKYVSLDATNYTIRTWIECIKVAVIQNGRFDCYYA